MEIRWPALDDLNPPATDAEIKKAYRRIAKTDHPDLNPDPKAHDRFKAASTAYDLLKDPEQRRRFVADMDEKQRIYGERYPIDDDFLAALAHMRWLNWGYDTAPEPGLMNRRLYWPRGRVVGGVRLS